MNEKFSKLSLEEQGKVNAKMKEMNGEMVSSIPLIFASPEAFTKRARELCSKWQSFCDEWDVSLKPITEPLKKIDMLKRAAKAQEN